MRGKRPIFFTLGAGIAAGSLLLASEPSAAPFRSAFEAQFPKTEATGAARELERIAATLGIDLVPKEDPFAFPAEAAPKESEARPESSSIDGNRRSRPSAEESAAHQRVSSALADFVDRELKTPEEKIGAPPAALEGFLSDHDGALSAIESVLLRGEARWEMDVGRGFAGPLPNLMGHMRLARLLVARALTEARRGEMEIALQTLEAAWRLVESLSLRPEMISQLIVLAAARLPVGALRKLDTPAYGWADRLRDGKLFSGFLAAFQNEVWFVSEIQDLTGEAGAYGRALRQIAEEFQREDLCGWTPEKLREMWDRSFREQYSEDDASGFQAPNLLDGFTRWRRFLVDAELTALVLDARAERAASRRRAWPAKLMSVGRGVCPGSAWSYRPGKETAAFAFEGRLAEGDSAGLRLPLTFTAGVPAAPAPPTPRPTPVPAQRKI